MIPGMTNRTGLNVNRCNPLARPPAFGGYGAGTQMIAVQGPIPDNDSRNTGKVGDSSNEYL